jgi:hypothetical protein
MSELILNNLGEEPAKKLTPAMQHIPAKALTYDTGKPPLANLPWAAIEGMSQVQAYGHQKYKDFNNYRKGMEVTRNLSCALRHIKEYLEGHDVDAESGEHPLAHAMCRIAFVLQNIDDGKAIDDRYKP